MAGTLNPTQSVFGSEELQKGARLTKLGHA